MACLYAPPRTAHTDIIMAVEHIKSLVCATSRLIIGGDFNIDLMSDDNSSVDFLDNLHALSLHPVISLPTRVTKNTSTLLDNFLCDISLLPVHAAVIKTDVSDHYLIQFSLSSLLTTNKSARLKRNFSRKNKAAFTSKLLAADWSHLYTLHDADIAFSFFLRKFKRKYNKCFPFETVLSPNRKAPWLTKGILNSIRHKNKLFLKANHDPTLTQVYKTYRNKLTSLIRTAKLNYHKHVLSQLKNNARKMWTHVTKPAVAVLIIFQLVQIFSIISLLQLLIKRLNFVLTNHAPCLIIPMFRIVFS